MTVDEPQLRQSIDDAIDTVMQVARAEFWQVAQAGEHTEETPFAIAQAANGLTIGVIDLLFKSADGWRVRDYKTDVSLDASAFTTTVEAYRGALEKLQCNVVNAVLVSVRDGD